MKQESLTEQLPEKQLRKTIQEKLAFTLVDYKEGLSEKKFLSGLKKVSKLLAADFAKASRKKEKRERKAEKNKKE